MGTCTLIVSKVCGVNWFVFHVSSTSNDWIKRNISCVGLGCKHSKVDQTSVPVYESSNFLGQMPISSSKMFFKIDYFSS